MVFGAGLGELRGTLRAELEAEGLEELRGVARAGLLLGAAVRDGAERAGELVEGMLRPGAAAFALSGAGRGLVLPARSALRAPPILSEIDSRDARSVACPRACASAIGSRVVGALARTLSPSGPNASNHRSRRLGSERRRSAPTVVGRDSMTRNPFMLRNDSGMCPHSEESKPDPPG